MKAPDRRRGSSMVEAAILFPIIILFTAAGFSLMTLWYSQWEKSLEEHNIQRRESEYSESITKLQREQWNEFLGEDDEGEG